MAVAFPLPMAAAYLSSSWMQRGGAASWPTLQSFGADRSSSGLGASLLAPAIAVPTRGRLAFTGAEHLPPICSDRSFGRMIVFMRLHGDGCTFSAMVCRSAIG